MKKYFTYLAITAFVFTSCDPEFNDSVEDGDLYSTGEADFTNFVSVGNSLTAGFADNALYIEGQENSFPNIMAKQFELLGGGDFVQPLMNDNLGGLLLGGNQIMDTRLVLGVDEEGNPGPRNISGTPTTEITNSVYGGQMNNFGVPGAKSFHLVAPGYGNVAGVQAGAANPYFVRFASSNETTVLGDAMEQNPSFFSLWIGNNDILGYATAGGAGVNQQGNLDPTTYGGNDITDINVFGSVYSNLTETLASSTSGGVVFNIPDVTTIPFFTTVPHNPVPLSEDLAVILNANFQGYNEQILPGLVQLGVISEEEMALRQISFSAGQGNAVTMIDEDLTDLTQILQGPPFNLDPQTAALLGQLRQANETDLVVLTAASFIGSPVPGGGSTAVNGVSVPLADQWVLTASEQAEVEQARVAYNSIIQSLANEYDLAFVDVAMLLQEVEEGLPTDSGVLTSEFAAGGAFSLDGVHLTPRGYAVVANRAIDAINEKYNSSVPRVNPGDFRTIQPSNN